MTDELEGPEVGRVEIVRTINADGDLIDNVRAVDGNGEDLGLTEALGMMRLAEDTLIRMRMEDDD